MHALVSGTIASEDAIVAPVIVHDSAGGVLLVPDSLDRVAASPRVSVTLARIAAAWSLQNLRLFFGDAPSRQTRSSSPRRDVRERLDALRPFFEQGSNDEFPVVVGDLRCGGWSISIRHRRAIRRLITCPCRSA